MAEKKRPPEFADGAPPDRYCDLILTGGVTSAVAYPGVIAGLATTYRFNAIGGSSSGAGAAALAAAAEYRRRHGSADGFRLLVERTAAVSNLSAGKTGLEWLFQPAPRGRRLFDALLPIFVDPDRTFGSAICAIAKAYRGPALVGVAFALAIVALVWRVCGPHPVFAVLAGFALALLLAILAILLALKCDAERLVDMDYGLCDGMQRQARAPRPPLTAWLHELIQEIAGKAADSPLTFADLKSAPGSPRETLGDHSDPGRSSIDLQMYTSNVTHGRPYRLPQDGTDTRLYFRPSELAPLFPASVVQHMKQHARPYRPVRDDDPPASTAHGRLPWWRRSDPSPPGQRDVDLHELPTDQLPVVVAARMSVSFPVLFSAVPLWAVDRRSGQPRLRRCLFSDGGICSSFPIHLFDSPIPAWPTFGIALRAAEPHETACDDPISLPIDHREGREDRWSRFDDRPNATGRLVGFAAALLDTAKDWNDSTLSRMPGVRDRVVSVRLEPKEGGLNIRMTPAQIDELSKKGLDAARRLLERFSQPSSPIGTAQGWNEHRWVRFNVLRDSLSRSLAGLTWSAAQGKYAQPLRQQIRGAIDEPPLKIGTAHTRCPAQGGGVSAVPDDEAVSQLLPGQAAALEGLLAALSEAERALTTPGIDQPYQPKPPPDMRVRPPL